MRQAETFSGPVYNLPGSGALLATTAAHDRVLVVATIGSMPNTTLVFGDTESDWVEEWAYD